MAQRDGWNQKSQSLGNVICDDYTSAAFLAHRSGYDFVELARDVLEFGRFSQLVEILGTQIANRSLPTSRLIALEIFLGDLVGHLDGDPHSHMVHLTALALHVNDYGCK